MARATDVRRRHLPVTLPGLVAGSIVVVTEVVYLSLIASEGSNDVGRVGLAAGQIALAAGGFIGGSLVRSAALRSALLSFGTAIAVVLGLLAIFSIGILLVVGGLLGTVAVALALRRHTILPTLAGAAAGLLVTGAAYGLVVTGRA